MKDANGHRSRPSHLLTSRVREDRRSRASRATLAAHAFGKTNLQMGEFLHTGKRVRSTAQQLAFMRLAGSQEQFAHDAGELDNATRETTLAFTGLRNAAAAGSLPCTDEAVSNIATDFHREAPRGDQRVGDEDWRRQIERWVEGGGLTRLGETSWARSLTGLCKVDRLPRARWASPSPLAAVLFAPLIALRRLARCCASLAPLPALIALGGVLAPAGAY
jgi:hypothetical protein